MELLTKNRVMLFTALTLTMASCGESADLLPEPADPRFTQSREWTDKKSFREITVQSDDYSVLFLADSHSGTTRNLESVFGIATESGASAVCIAGDLTDGDVRDYRVFAEALPGEDEIPTFVTPGNHDLWSENGWNEFYSWFGPSSYYFTVLTPDATDMYIALDSGSGTLGAGQLEWLENILKTKRPDCRHCIVFTHNNLLRFRHSLISNPLVEELNILINLFTVYNVEMLIAGHDHEHDAVMFGITNYLITGSISDEDPDACYLEVGINKGSLSYEFREVN
jgi:3',5'-cyclic AMP phosphodiesterase CpdA